MNIVKLSDNPLLDLSSLQLARAEVDAAKDKLAKLEVGRRTGSAAAEHLNAYRMPASPLKLCAIMSPCRTALT